jgi:hypothetical protein
MEGLEFKGEEELFGEEVTTPLAWVTTTLVDWRFDRLDVIDQSGNINDYKDIFTTYLTDNKTYLESFGGKDDIAAQRTKQWEDFVQGSNLVYNFFDYAGNDGKLDTANGAEEYFDIEYIAFFNTKEEAQSYVG